MNLFIYTPCCENTKLYITELETKWFMMPVITREGPILSPTFNLKPRNNRIPRSRPGLQETRLRWQHLSHKGSLMALPLVCN